MKQDLVAVKSECESCVTDQIQLQNEMKYCDFCGYSEGILAVIQHHVYLVDNAMLFERQCRNGIFNCGHIDVPLMLYYISQEPDFDLWFDVKVMSKLSHHCSKKHYILDACAFALLMFI